MIQSNESSFIKWLAPVALLASSAWPNRAIAQQAPGASADPLVLALRVQPGGLTAARAAERAQQASPAVRAKLAEVERARARIKEATAAFFPRLTAKASYTRLSPLTLSFGNGGLLAAGNVGPVHAGACPDGSMGCVVDTGGQPVVSVPLSFAIPENNYALEGMLTVPLSDYAWKLPAAAQAADAYALSAEEVEGAERARAERDGRVLYYNWIRSLGQVAIAEKSLAQTASRLRDVEAAAGVGRATTAEVLRVQTQHDNTQRLLDDAIAYRALAAATLAEMVGDEPGVEYRVGEDVLAPVEPPPPLDALSQRALSRRADYRAAEDAIRAAVAAERVEKAGLSPRVEAFGDVLYANPNPRVFPPLNKWDATWALGISASFTVNDAVVSGFAGQEAHARLLGLRAERDRMRRQIQLEIMKAHTELGAAIRAIGQSGLALRSAGEAYRETVELYRVGNATTTEIIAAETDLVGARLASLNAAIDARIARAQLDYAIGDAVR